ncbi:G-protein coupled receptor 39 isoform X3 [Bubalus kerabau]|uniref:G-protein coupled receptor 39 isoform X3 n=2 Tax=Bubalus carabanensis TaxID=3119969 RepID=UPI00244EFEB5|nr:G-protein coupled receptor 39 isoform X3 [Bubalus carabanensis]
MASTSHPSRDCSQVIDHSHVPEFEVATWIKITLILVYLVIFVVGILGNSVTIRVTQVLQKKGYLQKEVTDHMVSLACSDILVFLIGMPMEFYSIIWNPLTTPSYTVSCKVHTFLFEACSYATLLHVLTLSFERYIAICHPFRYKAMSGPCQVKLLIGFVWVTSALVALPLLFAMGVEYPLVNVPSHWGLTCNRSRTHHQEQPESSNMSICTNLSSRWTVFQSSIFGAFVVYLVVLVSVAFMCWSMMQVLRRSKQGTLAAQGQQLQLRKLESQESRSARRQTIIFLSDSVVKTLPANAGDARDVGFILRPERAPGGENGNPFQYSCLENPMDRGACGLQFIGLQRVGHKKRKEMELLLRIRVRKSS